MAGKGPFVVEAWAPWKIWGGHLPTPDPPPNGASASFKQGTFVQATCLENINVRLGKFTGVDLNKAAGQENKKKQ